MQGQCTIWSSLPFAQKVTTGSYPEPEFTPRPYSLLHSLLLLLLFIILVRHCFVFQVLCTVKLVDETFLDLFPLFRLVLSASFCMVIVPTAHVRIPL
jgi:hypothetical protein